MDKIALLKFAIARWQKEFAKRGLSRFNKTEAQVARGIESGAINKLVKHKIDPGITFLEGKGTHSNLPGAGRTGYINVDPLQDPGALNQTTGFSHEVEELIGGTKRSNGINTTTLRSTSANSPNSMSSTHVDPIVLINDANEALSSKVKAGIEPILDGMPSEEYRRMKDTLHHITRQYFPQLGKDYIPVTKKVHRTSKKIMKRLSEVLDAKKNIDLSEVSLQERPNFSEQVSRLRENAENKRFKEIQNIMERNLPQAKEKEIIDMIKEDSKTFHLSSKEKVELQEILSKRSRYNMYAAENKKALTNLNKYKNIYDNGLKEFNLSYLLED